MRTVGFSGAPVAGGAGIKPAVAAEPLLGHDVAATVARGLVSLLARPVECEDGSVVLYAHERFVCSGEGHMDLAPAMHVSREDAALGILYWCLPADAATRRLRAWGEVLLADAEEQLRQGKYARALDSAERAGYAVLPPRDDAFGRRVMVALGAAYLGLGRDIAPVLEDARIDFDADAVEQIRRDADRLTLRVVGFSGSVSEGAAAVKAPVFERGGRYYSGDPHAPSTTCDRSEIEEHERRGLVTLCGPWPRVPGGVVLYAHANYVHPSDGGPRLDVGSLAWVELLGAHVGYMPREQALAVLRGWAEALLDDARAALARSDYASAKASSMRSRFAATLDHPELRQEAHACVIAARLGLGEAIDGVLRSVRVDFGDDATVHAVEQRARKLSLRG